MRDRVGNDILVGDFIVYATKTESPSLQFAWVEEFKSVKARWSDHTNTKVKIQRAHPDGTRINKQAVDVPGHWPDDMPIELRTHKNYANYISTTYRDTGRPDTVWLDTCEQDYRMMVVQPV